MFPLFRIIIIIVAVIFIIIIIVVIVVSMINSKKRRCCYCPHYRPTTKLLIHSLLLRTLTIDIAKAKGHKHQDADNWCLKFV